MKNREIKFRVWCDIHKWMWLPGECQVRFAGPHGDAWDIVYDKRGYPPKTVSGHHKETIMQFTGLTDADGKEIFEGDVVTCDMDYKGKIYHETKEVYWTPGTTGFHPLNDELLVPDSVHVIGNIFENPDLV